MDKSYFEYKKEIGRNMCGEPIYKTIYIQKFINCLKCGKELKNFALKYSIKNGKKVADMDGSDGDGVPCDCGWWN